MYYMVIIFQLINGNPLLAEDVLQSDNLMTLTECQTMAADFTAQMIKDKEHKARFYCVGPVGEE